MAKKLAGNMDNDADDMKPSSSVHFDNYSSMDSDRKHQDNMMPLHEVLSAMGHHKLAKTAKKHAPKAKTRISSISMHHGKKGGMF